MSTVGTSLCNAPKFAPVLPMPFHHLREGWHYAWHAKEEEDITSFQPHQAD